MIKHISGTILQYMNYINRCLISSPEPKAQVSYYHRNLSGVRLLTFSFKRHLIKNHLANFNHTWWETCLGMGI